MTRDIDGIKREPNGRFAEDPKFGGTDDLDIIEDDASQVVRYSTFNEARNSIAESIEEGGVVDDAESQYDLDAIVDEVYEQQTDDRGNVRYRQKVSADDFWESVQRYEIYTPKEAADRRKIQACGVDPDNMVGANFNGGDLSGVVFSNADLSGANLDGCYLVGAKFRSSNLKAADLTGVRGNRAIFADADLTDAVIRKARLGSPNFRAARLDGASFSSSELWHPNFNHVDLRRTDLGDLSPQSVITNEDVRSATLDARARHDLGLDKTDDSRSTMNRAARGDYTSTMKLRGLTS